MRGSAPRIASEWGRGLIDPACEVRAGSFGTWRLMYVVGSAGFPPGAVLRIDTDSDTDWGLLQTSDPREPDFLGLRRPDGADLAVIVESRRAFRAVNTGRPLGRGEQVVFVIGDTSGGSPGTRVQTFTEDKRYFRIQIAIEEDENFHSVPNPPFLRISGGQAAKLEVVAPSRVRKARPFMCCVRAVDAFGNPSEAFAASIVLSGESMSCPASEIRFTPEDRGVIRIAGCSFHAEGILRIHAACTDVSMSAWSNPVQCLQEMKDHDVFWGDLHGGQMALAEKIPSFFRYARDVSLIHFVGYQRNDFAISDEDWLAQQKAEREFSRDGRFVVIPGYEWSGRTPQGGHHNVYFDSPGTPLRRSAPDADAADSDALLEEGALPRIQDLYDAVGDRGAVLVPHVGGEEADLRFHDPSLEPVVEVTSTHGSFDWFAFDALRRGYSVGFTGGSDGYTGRPGGETPGYQERRFAKGGLTAVLCSQLTLADVLDAVKSRRCYATTGPRILLDLRCSGRVIGEEFESRDPPCVCGTIAGTAPLETVELYRGSDRIHVLRPALVRDPCKIRVLCEGSSRRTSYAGVRYRVRLSLEQATLARVETVRFEGPRSRVLRGDASGVEWTSCSCGYPSGVILELDRETDGSLLLSLQCDLFASSLFGGRGDRAPRRMTTAKAEDMTFRVSLGRIRAQGISISLGDLDRRLKIDCAPQEGGVCRLEYQYTDHDVRPGINAYWLKVCQTDMEMAWSSPFFVRAPRDGGTEAGCSR